MLLLYRDALQLFRNQNFVMWKFSSELFLSSMQSMPKILYFLTISDKIF